MADWDQHKMKCKEHQNCFKPVKLDSGAYLGRKPATKKLFMVKVYSPGGTHDLILKTRDGFLESHVSKKCPNFKQLEKIVSEKGFWGVAAYCNAKWSEGKGLMIDMENVLPYQNW